MINTFQAFNAIMHLDFELLKSYIKPNDAVLDLGGWARPLKRANFVVDALPFKTRGMHGYIGDEDSQELFDENSWIEMDFCSVPLPFKDKEIDFINFAGTLEDVKDPLVILKEIARVGKRGYLEFPNRCWEQSYNSQSRWRVFKKSIGFYNHRWFVEFMKDSNTLKFTPKYNLIDSLPKLVIKNDTVDTVNVYEIKNGQSRTLKFTENARYIGLFWESGTDAICEYDEIPFMTAKDFAQNCLEYKIHFDKLSHDQRLKLNKYLQKQFSVSMSDRIFRKLKNQI